MENHKFKQLTYSKLCGVCYRPKLDEYHVPFFDENDLTELPSKLGTANGDKLNDHGNLVEVEQSSIKPKTSSEESNQPDCYGHKCPVCNDFWHHNYKCWPDARVKEVMHCPKCFGQAVVEINREKDLKQIIAESEQVTPKDVLVSAAIEHESFLYLEIMKLAPEYREQAIIEHINKCRMMCEKFSSFVAASKKVGKKIQAEEMEKLTPEEIQDFQRRAQRQKKLGIEDKRAEDKKAYERMLKDMIKAVGNEALAEKITNDTYKAQGKEIPS